MLVALTWKCLAISPLMYSDIQVGICMWKGLRLL